MSSFTTSRLGLSVFCGGYRATAFHLGTFKKLQPMNVLGKVDVISTIWGGSSMGAYYCLYKDKYQQFYESLYDKLQTKNFIKKVLLSWIFFRLILVALFFLATTFYFLFVDPTWLFSIFALAFLFILYKFQFYIFPVSKRIKEVYGQFFYEKKTLANLPEQPVLVIGSTNLQTARAFTFSKKSMQDMTYQDLNHRVTFEATQFPISRPVMASSCVPFAFTPTRIDVKFFTKPADTERIHPALVDGGVYDSQGIHKVIQRGTYACDIVIVSDSGTGPSGESTFSNTLQLLLETVSVFMSRIKKVQMVHDVYNNVSLANRQVAYFSLGGKVENCKGFFRNLIAKQITDLTIASHQMKAERIADPATYETAIFDHLKQRIAYDLIVKPTSAEIKIARAVGTT